MVRERSRVQSSLAAPLFVLFINKILKNISLYRAIGTKGWYNAPCHEPSISPPDNGHFLVPKRCSESHQGTGWQNGREIQPADTRARSSENRTCSRSGRSGSQMEKPTEGVQSLSHRQTEAVAGAIYKEMVEAHDDEPQKVPFGDALLQIERTFAGHSGFQLIPVGNPDKILKEPEEQEQIRN